MTVVRQSNVMELTKYLFNKLMKQNSMVQLHSYIVIWIHR
jgi:hypothetical protein